IVTGQYYNAYDTTTATATWPGNDPNFVGPATAGHTFSINEDQEPQLRASWGPVGPSGTVASLKVYTLSGALVYSVNFDGSQSSLTGALELAAGTYNYTLTASRKGTSITTSIIYFNNDPLIYNTLGPAPGLRVKTISHYDNTSATIPALVKQYTYQD